MRRPGRHFAAVLSALLALTLGACAGSPPRDKAQRPSTRAPGVLESLQAYQPERGRAEPKAASRTRSAKQTKAASTTVAPPTPGDLDPAIAILPAREPAQILRIWIAPWEDAAGNLHGASDLFTEITPRRWRLATAPGAPAGTVLTPLQLEPRKAPAADHTPDR